MENTTSMFLFIGAAIGLFLGVFLGILIVNTNPTVVLDTEVLDEVCVQLYGEGTESYTPNWFVIETELKCRNAQIVEKEITPESKIKFIDEECGK